MFVYATYHTSKQSGLDWLFVSVRSVKLYLARDQDKLQNDISDLFWQLEEAYWALTPMVGKRKDL